MNNLTNTFNDISLLLQKGKAKEITAAVEKALNEGIPAQDILDKSLISGMNIIGGKFKNGEIFIPEVLVAARAMNKASETLKPILVEAGVKPIGKAIICTVKGDLHDIGKNLVRMMIEGRGIEVIDLGVDCGIEKIIESVQNSGARVLCLSALLTTTMLMQKEIIAALRAAGLRDKVKIMVGGAPVTRSFAIDIGADAYTPDAATAAMVCRSFYD